MQSSTLRNSGETHYMSSSSSSLKRIPKGNLGSYGPYGDKDLQSRLKSVVFDASKEHPYLTIEKWYRNEERDVLELVRVISYYDRLGRLKTRQDLGHLSQWQSVLSKRFSAKRQSAEKALPCIRTRKTGRVGPEPDWSIRYSRLPRTWGSGSTGLDLVRAEIIPPLYYNLHQPLIGRSCRFSPHDCSETYAMSDEQVLKWTQYAHVNNICFNGDFGYVQGPREPLSSEKISELNSHMFREGRRLKLIKRHTRSDYSRIIRSAKRGKQEVTIRPLPAGSLFVQRYRMSAKDMRKAWFNHHGKLPFQKFKALQEKCITLFPKQCRSPIPGIVYESLKRIYSKPERFLPDQPWFSKVDHDLSYTLRLGTPGKMYIPTNIMKVGSVVHSMNRLDGLGLMIPRSTIPRFDRETFPSFIDWTGRFNAVGAEIGFINETFSTSINESHGPSILGGWD